MSEKTDALSALAELEGRATRGPWVTCPYKGRIRAAALRNGAVCQVSHDETPEREKDAADAALICAMRNALPGLLRVARAAEAVTCEAVTEMASAPSAAQAIAAYHATPGACPACDLARALSALTSGAGASKEGP